MALTSLFELCTEHEWQEAERGQHRSGPKPFRHRDVALAVRYLAANGIGARVKIKCPEDWANYKRDAARDHAYRRGIAVITRYDRNTGYVLIEFSK